MYLWSTDLWNKNNICCVRQQKCKSFKIYICSPTRYTKCFNEWVYSALMLARHVSDLTGPSSGAFCTSCIRRLWYVVILVLLNTSSCCNGWTCWVVRWINSLIEALCVSCWTAYILQDDTRSLQCQLLKYVKNLLKISQDDDVTSHTVS